MRATRRPARPVRVDRRSSEASERRATANRLRALRRRSDTERSNTLIIATLRARIPPNQWLGRFSARHPHLRLEILSYVDRADGWTTADCWIAGGPSGFWAAEIAGISDVRSAVSLAEVGGGCLYRITFQNPPVIAFYRSLGLPLPLPIRIQAGRVAWEIVARYPDYLKILDFAGVNVWDARVTSVHRGPLRSHLPSLTPTQQRILTAAIEQGYFAVPRRTNLSELARSLNRSPSTLSTTLATIEEKLIESALRTSPSKNREGVVSGSAEPL